MAAINKDIVTQDGFHYQFREVDRSIHSGKRKPDYAKGQVRVMSGFAFHKMNPEEAFDMNNNKRR